MMIEETGLDGVLQITPRRFSDSRGHFSETYSAHGLADAGIDITFVQDNQSFSRAVGTLRGLHFQAPPAAQAKLVRALQGEIWDVAVDVRVGSPTYGKWTGVTLSAETGNQLLIPAGFLHGFVTRVPDCIVAYKCSAPYMQACEGAVRFDDPDLAIDWGIDHAAVVLSEKDAAAPLFRDLASPFTWDHAA